MAKAEVLLLLVLWATVLSMAVAVAVVVVSLTEPMEEVHSPVQVEGPVAEGEALQVLVKTEEYGVHILLVVLTMVVRKAHLLVIMGV